MAIIYRRGAPDDADACFEVFAESLSDLIRSRSGPDAPLANRNAFKKAPAYDFMARAADEFWVAESDGQVIGVALALRHGDVLELTEFFVLPAHQSAGVGRELLARAFRADGARRRIVVATQSEAAQARYLLSGAFPRFPVRSFERVPEPVAVETDLRFEPAPPTASTLAAFAAIDQEVLEFRRDAVHEFLLTDRQGYTYWRGTELVGYGYVRPRAGPFALRDASDFPAVLAHAESDAASRGVASFSLCVPLTNRFAVTYLLERHYHFGGRMLCMSDGPIGKFEQYVMCIPEWFI